MNNVERALSFLYTSALGSASRRGINVRASAEMSDRETVRRTRLEFPDLEWSCEADETKVVITHAGIQTAYPWAALDPRRVEMSVEMGQRVLYHEPSVMVTHAMQPDGPWSSVTAPGIFLLWAWNAAYRWWDKPAQSPPQQGAKG
jgi:hypothetical protein